MQVTDKAIQHLSKDPVLKKIIEQVELQERRGQNSVYEALIRSIVFQQLSGKAASTIHRRFLNLFENGYPHPQQILDFPIEALRSVGLSRQKASYIQNVAHFFVENKLLEKDWAGETDQAIIEQLTIIKGVGQWTVEMILMFTLGRMDVLPLDDLVVKNSMIRLYGVEAKGRALKKKLLAIAEPWRPYRTIASLYLWESQDTVI
ncbi:MAG: DNA-3-methyladenine glycosylase 2 family protein [Bacteroidota bacterium]